MSQIFTVKNIKSDRIKNLVRGCVTAENNHKKRLTFKNLRKECSERDIASVVSVLFGSRDVMGVLLPISFPNSLDEVRGCFYFDSCDTKIELLIHSELLKQNEEHLALALKSISEINNSFFNKDLQGFLKKCEGHIKEFGISLCILRKIISAKHAFVSVDAKVEFSKLLKPFYSPQRELLAFSFEDSIDRDLDYIRMRRMFLRSCREGHVKSPYLAVIYDALSPYSEDAPDFSETLQSVAIWGVIDTFLFLMRNDYVSLGKQKVPIKQFLPTTLVLSYEALFSYIDAIALGELISGSSEFREYRFFSHLPAWSEYPEVNFYRQSIEQGMGERFDGDFPVKREISREFCPSVSKVNSLFQTERPKFNVNEIQPRHGGKFHRTIAFSCSLNEIGQTPVKNGEEMFHLLEQTIDLAKLLSPEEHWKFFGRIKKDSLYNYLRDAVIRDAEEGRVSDHALRRSLQTLVSSQHDGDIVALAKFFDRGGFHVAEHLYANCSEAFLTMLLKLYDNADDVVNAHASLMEWYGETRGDEEAIIRAQSHRLNLKLRKVRGSIDETRIYVDPLRFNQWVLDVISLEIREVTGQISEVDDENISGVDVSNPIKGKERPILRIAQILDTCFREFCENKYYGVASYIGRRIRHGTLHGVLVSELNPVLESVYERHGRTAPGFVDRVKEWQKKLDDKITYLGAEVLHFKSEERKRGVFEATVMYSQIKWRIAETASRQIERLILEKQPMSSIISVVYEYCWLWLEIDLKAARKIIEQYRVELVLEPSRLTKNIDDPKIEQSINDCIRIINSELRTKFEVVSSWLTRPSKVSPTAPVSLLLHAVLEEVSNRFEKVDSSRLTIDGDEVDLYGHSFQLVYDALFVIVANAVEHGKRDGKINSTIKSSLVDDNHRMLVISITSELDPETASKQISNMNNAMDAEVGDAMLQESGTGIRKVKSLVQTYDEIDAFRMKSDLTTKRVTFDLTMKLIST